MVCLLSEIGPQAVKLVSREIKSAISASRFKVLTHLGGAGSILQRVSLLADHLS